MRAFVTCVFIAATLAGCSSGDRHERTEDRQAQRPSDADAEAYMRKAEADWAALPPKEQPALLGRILADDFVAVGTKGAVRNKAEQIEADLNAPPAPPAMLDYVRYRHFGDTVLAQGQETSPAGKDQSATTLVWTDVWMFRNGKWQIVAAQDTVLQPKK